MNFEIKLNRILCPIDFSASSHAANFYASMFAQSSGAQIVYLAVNYPPANDSVEDRLDDLYSKLIAEIRPLSHEVNFMLEVRDGNPSEEILKYANERMVDLIVMGTHGYTGFDRLLHGSVCGKVLRKASCPVMAVKNVSKFNPVLDENEATVS